MTVGALRADAPSWPMSLPNNRRIRIRVERTATCSGPARPGLATSSLAGGTFVSSSASKDLSSAVRSDLAGSPAQKRWPSQAS